MFKKNPPNKKSLYGPDKSTVFLHIYYNKTLNQSIGRFQKRIKL